MKNMTRGDICVGISGWRYTPWRGSFYPEKLVQKRELYYASRTVNSIEINGSFYAFQTPKSYTSWYGETPDDFIFSVKCPRLITHLKRLHEVEIPIADFFASGVLELDEKLSALLWQFPPSFKFNPDQFKHFLKLLPRTTHEALACAQKSDAVQHYKTLKQIADKPLRYSIEIRNESFRTPEFVELLREFNAALVVADTAGRWPQMEDITSDFMYMRLHGDAELYRSGYSDEALKYWHDRIDHWSQGQEPANAKLTSKPTKTTHSPRDIYCYFDNTDKLWAPYDARKILEKFDLAKNLEEAPGQLSEAIKKLISRKKSE